MSSETQPARQKDDLLADFKQFDFITQCLAVLAIAMTGIVIYDQYFYWSTVPDYSFGYLVPLFAAYVVYDRWPKIAGYLSGSQEDAPGGQTSSAAEMFFNICFVLGLVGSLLVFFMGALIRAGQGPSSQGSLALALGIAGIFLGFAYFCGEKDSKGRAYSLKQRLAFAMLFLFPAFVWMISSPMVDFFYSTLKLYLLEMVTIVVYHTFDFLGFTLIREGNVLVMPKGRVGVADACSGIRSLTGCIFAGTFLAAVFLDRFWKKSLMLIAACILAFIMNICRSLFLTGWAYAYGAGAIDEKVPVIGMTVHDIAGFAVLGMTVLFLLALLPIFTLSFEDDDEDDDDSHGELSHDGQGSFPGPKPEPNT